MRIEHSVLISSTIEDVWSAIAALDGFTALFGGVLGVEDADQHQVLAIDDQYRFVWHLGATVSGGKVEFVAVNKYSDIEWVSVTGTHHRGRVILTADASGRTRTTVKLNYQPPGPAGFLAALVAAPRLQRAIRRGMLTVKTGIESSVER